MTVLQHETTPTTRADRYRGALLGLAAGDALGTTLEFTGAGNPWKPRVTEIVGGGPFGLSAGAWTDDTSMALCLAASFVHCGGFDARDQMERYVRWRHDGYYSTKGYCFDIGGTTSAALSHYLHTGKPFAGSTSRNTAGNGSLMRLAPAVLAAPDEATAVLWAADSSRVTHAAPQAVSASRYYGMLIFRALQGASKDDLLHAEHDLVLDREVRMVANGSFLRKQPPAIRGTGYAVDALEAALWAFANSDTFRDGAILAVNLGNDADTTGAIFGQLAGAYYGLAGIPEAWRSVVQMSDHIVELADGLLTLTTAKEAHA